MSASQSRLGMAWHGLELRIAWAGIGARLGGQGASEAEKRIRAQAPCGWQLCGGRTHQRSGA